MKPVYILTLGHCNTIFNIILPSTFIITVSFPKSMLAHVHFLAHDVKYYDGRFKYLHRNGGKTTRYYDILLLAGV